jgi:hypothetical protein
MSPKQEVTIKVNVKELAKEIPLEVFAYEYGLDDIMVQLFKTFGMADVKEAVSETEDWILKGNKL